MQLVTRFGLAGMGGLAILTLVHQVRDRRPALPPAGDYLIGVLPNFAAAIAISFVLLSIWSDRDPSAGFAATQRRFLVCAAISGVGLLAWEFFQKTSRNLVFDPHDIGATFIGLAVAGGVFRLITPRDAT